MRQITTVSSECHLTRAYFIHIYRFIEKCIDRPRIVFRKLLIVSFITGVFTLSFTNPIWVVKTRMCLQTEAATSQVYYNGVLGN